MTTVMPLHRRNHKLIIRRQTSGPFLLLAIPNLISLHSELEHFYTFLGCISRIYTFQGASYDSNIGRSSPSRPADLIGRATTKVGTTLEPFYDYFVVS
jgi:hypothetical protein